MLLETQRLVLRPPKKEDEYFFYQLNKDPEVMKLIRPVMDRAASKEYFQQACEMTDGKTGYSIAVDKTSAEFVGWFVLKQFEETDKMEFGFRLMRRFWGQGLATEGAMALKEYVFNTLKLEQLVAVTHLNNDASVNVLLKTGFEYKGNAFHYNTDVKYFELNKYNLMG